MDAPAEHFELYEILRQLARVSAALNQSPENRNELLAEREMLLAAARELGFSLSEDQQRALCERLAVGQRHQELGNATRDHQMIQLWALQHDAVPAEVRQPVFDGQPSALRFLSGAAKKGTPELCPISWESFFARFDLMGLAVVFDRGRSEYEFVPAETTRNRPSD